MARIVIPVFVDNDLWYAREAWKGIIIREKRKSNTENIIFLGEDLPLELPKRMERINEWKKKGFQFGIIIVSSTALTLINEKLKGFKDFLLIAPLSCGKTSNENIFQLILANWEVKAIKNFFKNANIDDSDIEILTDITYEEDHYFKEFKKLVNHDKKKNKRKASDVNAKTCIVIGIHKRKLILDLRNKKETDLIITTSSFENWLMPNRKQMEDIYYTYPKLSSDAEIIIREFKEEYGYRPSICALLGYDAANIAIKSIMNGGPSYEGIKHYLIHHTFDLITIGKISFTTKGIPYLIGKKPENIFEIKYVDKDGNFKILKG